MARLSPSSESKSTPEAVPGWLPWLLPPVMLASTLGGIAWILQRPDGLVGYVLGFLALIVAGWIMTSVLWPARADRTCPECGSEKLVRLDQATTIGVRCTACEHVDDTVSSWYMAEEEGPLEELVLAQRKARRTARHGHQGSTFLQPQDQPGPDQAGSDDPRTDQ